MAEMRRELSLLSTVTRHIHCLISAPSSGRNLLRLHQAAFIAGFGDSILCGGQMLGGGAPQNGPAAGTSESGG
ncbi:hypothetical protein VU08_07935, partial [Desulfobulbus sp. F5]|nr:hypothetical protein [Desulfobulbus sp. F5]